MKKLHFEEKLRVKLIFISKRPMSIFNFPLMQVLVQYKQLLKENIVGYWQAELTRFKLGISFIILGSFEFMYSYSFLTSPRRKNVIS